MPNPTIQIDYSQKSPMTMTTFRSTDMNLLHENLSRARMPQPQDEAHRSGDGARRVAMRARARQARELGEMSQSESR
jgi:hypothetical protein